MPKASDIIDKFGGQSALARLLNKRQSTIRHWYVNGIPAKWQKPLLDLAEKQGINLQPDDFFVESKEIEIVHKIPKATHWGELPIGGALLPCYNLETGERVFALKGVMVGFIGIEAGNLADYLMVKSLKPYLPPDLIPDEGGHIPVLIEFDTTAKGFATHGLGFPVEKLIDLCVAYSNALDGKEKNKLTERQREIAATANKFLRATAKVGIIALVDEVTGYQYDRPIDALQLKLRLFLEEEMRPWETTFPDELWIEFQRLTNWQGPLHLRPKWWGKLVNELIYGYLDADVFKWLQTHAPKPRHGQNYHQWLTSQYGLKRLIEHIWMTIGMAKACHTMDELRERMGIQFGRHRVQLSLFLPPPSRKVPGEKAH